jgi:hypothetical protein
MTYSNRQVFAIFNKDKTAILARRAGESAYEMVSGYTEDDIIYAIPNTSNQDIFDIIPKTKDAIVFFSSLDTAFSMTQYLKSRKHGDENSKRDLVIVAYSVVVSSTDILVSDLEKPEHIQWLDQYESFLGMLGDEYCRTAKSYRKDDCSGYTLPYLEENFHNWFKNHRVQG